jgi:hypothetical protein
MRNSLTIFVFVFLALTVVPGAIQQARAAADSYPAMAPLDQYLIADQTAEIALARSAAPASVADGATVMVLGPQGYTTAVQGKNDFLCIVGRSWAKATSDAEFWNPKLRSPNCFNAAAARSYLPVYLMKTRLVLAGKSKAEIDQALATALDHGKLPALEAGAMCYMMSKEQYLNDGVKSWHSHVMFFASGDVPASWGANLPGSPVISGHDPDARVTVFMVVVRQWSDGTPAPPMED